MKNNAPAPSNLLQWFNPRKVGLGSIAFIINRITAIGLSVYLVLHLIVLSKLAAGSQVYNEFLELTKSPIIIIGELLVIAGGVIHGLNGIRIALNSFGIFSRVQKGLFIGLMAISTAIILFFAFHMTIGN